MFRRLVLLGIVIALVFGLVVVQSPVQAQAPTTVTAKVSAFRLNIRASASIRAAKLGFLKRDAMVTVLGRNMRGNWLKIQTSTGLVGWVIVGWVKLSSGKVKNLPVVS